MRSWLNRLPPRIQGLAIIASGIGIVAAGFGVANLLGDQFLPFFFPGAGAIIPIGFFQLIAGHGQDDIAKRRVPRGQVIGVSVAVVAGVVVGLGANKVFFNVWW